MENDKLDPTRLVWLALVVLTAFGLGVVVLAPRGPAPGGPPPTPAPSPEPASLQCLDGTRFVSIEDLAGAPGPGGVPTRGRWTLAFADGGYVMDRGGTREAGRYRCDGATIVASGPVGAHRGHHDPAGGRLVWDAQGYERAPDASEVPAPAPLTTGTGG